MTQRLTLSMQEQSFDSIALTEELVAQYYSYIVRLSYSVLRDPAEAEDVAQDTFVTALLRIEQCDPDSNLRAWLSTIAMNKSRDILRKRKRKVAFQTMLQSVRSFTDHHSSPENTAVSNDANSRLWAAVDKLSEKHRLPVILRYVHNLSIREIAEILETKEGTIHSRLFYACKKLGADLEIIDVHQSFAKGVAR